MNGRALIRLAGPIAMGITTGLGGEARAADPPAESSLSCDEAFESADLDLRTSEGHLLDARAALRTCALPSCKAWMVDDCSKRLVEVEERIPSVAFSAQGTRGAPLYDVRVLEGDKELLGSLNGRAVEMDPGPHELVAERGGARVALSVVVVEGKKAQQVVFSFSPPPTSSDASPAKAPTPAPQAPALAYPWARPLAAGLLAGGVVAGGVGVGLSVVAISKKNEARCDAANFCDAEPLDSGRNAARAASVAFVVGGVLALGGLITLLTVGRTRAKVTMTFNYVQLATSW